MNKAEKVICLILGAVLAWYIFSETGKAKTAAGQDVPAQDPERAEDISADDPAVSEDTAKSV